MNELEMRRWADSHPIGEELFSLLDAANLKVSILVEQLAAAELRADALQAERDEALARWSDLRARTQEVWRERDAQLAECKKVLVRVKQDMAYLYMRDDLTNTSCEDALAYEAVLQVLAKLEGK